MVTNSGTDPLFVRLSYGNRMMNVPTKYFRVEFLGIKLRNSTLYFRGNFISAIEIFTPPNILDTNSQWR